MRRDATIAAGMLVLVTVAATALPSAAAAAGSVRPAFHNCSSAVSVDHDLGAVPTEVAGVAAAHAWYHPFGHEEHWAKHVDDAMDRKLVTALGASSDPDLASEFRVQVHERCGAPPVCTLDPGAAQADVCLVDGSTHYIHTVVGNGVCQGIHVNAGCPVGVVAVANASPLG